MSNTEILGMPVSADIPPTLMPYSVVAVVKALDDEGDEVYTILNSVNMTAMELAGMARFVSLHADEQLKEQIKAAIASDSLNSD